MDQKTQEQWIARKMESYQPIINRLAPDLRQTALAGMRRMVEKKLSDLLSARNTPSTDEEISKISQAFIIIDPVINCIVQIKRRLRMHGTPQDGQRGVADRMVNNCRKTNGLEIEN